MSGRFFMLFSSFLLLFFPSRSQNTIHSNYLISAFSGKIIFSSNKNLYLSLTNGYIVSQLKSSISMRSYLSLLILGPIAALLPCSALAEAADSIQARRPVQTINSELATKQTELETLQQNKTDLELQIQHQRSQIKTSAEFESEQNRKLQTAKINLANQYELMINDPTIDIQSYQIAYQQAWEAVKQHQKEMLEAQQQLAQLQQQYQQNAANTLLAQKSLDVLNGHQMRARVELLRDELTQPQNIEVTMENQCTSNTKLIDCANQTSTLALQKAVNQFKQQLIESTSENKLIKQYLNNASLNIQVLDYRTINTGFSGSNKYKATLDVSLMASPAKNAPCKLLNIDSQYCFAHDAQVQFSNSEELFNYNVNNEVSWVGLKLHSNQYNDKVTIDNVTYSSTPLELMLPEGKHHIVIEKEGYSAFNQTINLKNDMTLKAVLVEQKVTPYSGQAFSDKLPNGKKTPEVVIINAGDYFVGENAATRVQIPHMYSIGATLITVEQFETFIDNTHYQTDAELQGSCLSADEETNNTLPSINWRSPKFKQDKNFPVVCVSKRDAEAYVQWLSKITGATYRLPSEHEWEVAARAKTKTNYWWGNDFIARKANTGWSGSYWSNRSTSPVKYFPPNDFGLYDVVGNVWEWTNSPKGVTKGGAWSFSPTQATMDSSLSVLPTSSANYVGFRVLREL